MAHDPIARNQMVEISHFCNDIRFVASKSNFVSDWLSRPSAPISPANKILADDPDSEPAPDLHNAIDVAAVSIETISHAQLADQRKLCPNHFPSQRITLQDIEHEGY